MNFRFVLYSIGKLLQILGMVLLVPCAIALWECKSTEITIILSNINVVSFAIAVAFSFLGGTLLAVFTRIKQKSGGVREGFAIVTLTWLVFTLFGCIPFFIWFISQSSEPIIFCLWRCFTDAFFEVMSGFSTTGATILTDIESCPASLLFWRSMTQWLGGMGIVTLAIVIFPAFGVTGYQMFRGEMPGPTKERLSPRIAHTALALWGIYVLLTVVETVLLYFAGMSFFDSICHSFTTMSTGGFSPRNESIGAYNSGWIDLIIIIFMFLAGTNFVIHYRILKHRDYAILIRNSEFKFFVWIILGAIVIIVIFIKLMGICKPEDIVHIYRNVSVTKEEAERIVSSEASKMKSVIDVIRYASFQVVSIVTTTGFCTADFDIWPQFTKYLLLLLMFFGGCAGSTGGGMKMVRILIILKAAWREIKTMVQPRLILPIKIDGRAWEDKQVANIIGFFILYLCLFITASALMTALIPDFTTAISSVAATLGNIGPGLAGVGATQNYAWIPIMGKWILIICMLLGRLEIFTVFIALAPTSWKK